MTTLFSHLQGLSRRDHRATAKQAARAIGGVSGALRRRVFDFIKSRGEEGATDEEAQIALAMNPSTQRPRRVELERDGKVRDSGRQRATQAGRKATVWITTSNHEGA